MGWSDLGRELRLPRRRKAWWRVRSLRVNRRSGWDDQLREVTFTSVRHPSRDNADRPLRGNSRSVAATQIALSFLRLLVAVPASLGSREDWGSQLPRIQVPCGPGLRRPICDERRPLHAVGRGVIVEERPLRCRHAFA
jgi:hypothetical protein